MSKPPSEEAAAATDPALLQFQFVALATNKVVFEHVQRIRPTEGEVKPDQMNYNLTMGAGIKMLPNNQAEISLGVSVIPDAKWMPYRIEVEVLGRFTTDNGTPEQLDQFCRFAAPPILFPYVREIIHRVTMDGRFGAVRLNPINVQQMLNSTPWTTVEQKEQVSN